MDDMQFGTRDKRGNWAPNARLEIAPFWTGKFSELGRFMIGYVWPWNTFHMVMTLAYWFLLIQPNLGLFKAPTWAGFGILLAANMATIFAMYGSVELFYYIKRRQDHRFKYNHKFPSENPSDVFWFKSQNKDNFLRSFLITIPIWTVIEVFFLYCFTNGIHLFGWLDWQNNAVWLVVLVFLAPAIHEVHFFCIHWLIHQGPLYKYVHSIHHNSINPSPWSSLSMHPVEGALYFAQMLWHLVIPSHAVVGLFTSKMIGYGAINGHIGFDKLEITDETALDSHAYAHYLHHKYFEVNYGGDGIIPLDKWFGFWHDGSKEADEQMKARFRAKKERLKAKAAAQAAE